MFRPLVPSVSSQLRSSQFPFRGGELFDEALQLGKAMGQRLDLEILRFAQLAKRFYDQRFVPIHTLPTVTPGRTRSPSSRSTAQGWRRRRRIHEWNKSKNPLPPIRRDRMGLVQLRPGCCPNQPPWS